MHHVKMTGKTTKCRSRDAALESLNFEAISTPASSMLAGVFGRSALYPGRRRHPPLLSYTLAFGLILGFVYKCLTVRLIRDYLLLIIQ